MVGQFKQLLFAKIYYFDFSTKCSENDVNVKIIPRKSENSCKDLGRFLINPAVHMKSKEI